MSLEHWQPQLEARAPNHMHLPSCSDIGRFPTASAEHVLGHVESIDAVRLRQLRFMLPLPVLSRTRPLHRSGLRHQRSTKDALLTRARITNLGLLLLSGVTVLSLLVNLSHYFSAPSYYPQSLLHGTVPADVLSTIQRDAALSDIDHLIMVPGHAIWRGTDIQRRLDDDEWILEPYQRGGGRVAAFYRHIEAG